MKTKLILILSIGFVFFAQAQEGNPYMVNYEIPDKYSSEIFSICQDQNNTMFFATYKGILLFDGKNWDLFKMPSVPVVLTYDTIDNQVLIGNFDSFGRIYQNKKGQYQFETFTNDTTEYPIIENIKYTDNSIYYISEYEIFSINRKTPALDIIKLQTPTIGEFLFQNVLHIITDNNIYKISDSGLLKISNNNFGELIFSVPFQDYNLLGFENDKIYKFTSAGIKPFSYDDANYLEQSILTSAVKLNEKWIAISSLIGGCVILNTKTGKNVFKFNYDNGLPDNEIFSLYKDANKGLWLAHEYGLTRIEYQIPIRSFHAYPYLAGNINGVLEWNNTLYVASSEGVFFLDEILHKKTREITVKITQSIARKPTQKKTTIQQKTSTQESPLIEKKKLTRKERRLLRKKGIKKISNLVVETIKDPSNNKTKKAQTVKIQQQTTHSYRKQNIYELVGKSYEYKKFENINEKALSFFIYKNHIMLVTNTGLYEINKEEANKVIDNISVFQLYEHNNNLIVTSDLGLLILSKSKEKWTTKTWNIPINDQIKSITFDNKNTAWLAGEMALYQIKADKNYYVTNTRLYNYPCQYINKMHVKFADNKIHLFTPEVLYYVDEINHKLVQDSNFRKGENPLKFASNQQNLIWVKNNNHWIGYFESLKENTIESPYLELFDNVNYLFYGLRYLWFVDSKNAIYKVNLFDKNFKSERLLSCIFTSFCDIQNNYYQFDNKEISYKNNALKFTISAPSFFKENNILFSYYLSGVNDDWTTYNNQSEIKFPYIPYGNYELKVKAKDLFGNEVLAKPIQFTISSPYYLTWWFIAITIIVLVFFVFLIIRIRERKLKHDKQVLEQKVKERTEEILQQKKEIEDSIYYARRIQNAILPDLSKIKLALPEHFILWKPRDIVSGDYYWIKQIDNRILIVAADCTGHGVPGAFMSMLGISFLNEIVHDSIINDAGVILNQMREKVKETLGQTGKEGESKDGMDMAVCIIDKQTMKLCYSGAYNPLYLYRNNDLKETKADKMPIGIYIREKTSFTNHEIDLKPNDVFYIFSDGYVDQFGGPDGRKFKSKKFKTLLHDNHHKPMQEQLQILDHTIEEWKGENSQVDDILVVGIKITE